MTSNSNYKDPKRKVGSQSEVPKIKYENNKIIINGYQNFTINKKNKNIDFLKKKEKFEYINRLLHDLNSNHNCTSLVDIGCSAGLSSFIAYNNKFTKIFSLDHDPEYIQTIKLIKESCQIPSIQESVFSFGDKLNQTFDVVFCGALIHWIFSLTANFRNFDDIISYLYSITNKILVIEWVHPTDKAIKILDHLNINKKDGDEEYNTINFENALEKKFSMISKVNADCETRTIYCSRKI